MPGVSGTRILLASLAKEKYLQGHAVRPNSEGSSRYQKAKESTKESHDVAKRKATHIGDLMTEEQVIEVINKYAQGLRDRGYIARRCDPAGAANGYEQAAHMLWMCDEIQAMVGEGKLEKAFRWLGFIQGAMWAMGLRSIADMKLDNTSNV